MKNEHQDSAAGSGEGNKNAKKQAVEKGLGFPVVGIGASAGGLEALQYFFKHVPDESGIAFVVVQHLSPDYKSMMDELLARYTAMKVLVIEDGMRVKPNHVFLIPPRKNLTLVNGTLHLSEQEAKRQLNMPIDIFLRSLAHDQGKNATGIILSGTGSDGTLGIRAIKEHAGMVMVQDDHSAKFDGMPRSSIATGIVDYILPPDQMPGELVKFLNHPFITKTQKLEENADKDSYLSRISTLLKQSKGVDFSFYKKNTIIRRLEKRVSINQLNSMDAYMDFLKTDENELNILYKDLLIGVTRFFRDERSFEQLKKHVIPKIVANPPDNGQLRVWVVGCSTGEEAYSIAILLKEYMDENNLHVDVKIFATDLDKDSIEFASAGVYSQSIISDISDDRLARYFNKKEDRYQVGETIRSMVVFASHNVLKDPPFSKIDLLTCRNLLIYFTNEVQQRLLALFYYALNNNGYMFLGSSETVGQMSKGFKVFDQQAKIFTYQSGYRPNLGNYFELPPQPSRQQGNELPRQNREAKPEGHYLSGVFEGLINYFTPPTVILDQDFLVVHSIGDVGKLLSIPEGQITYEIHKMLPGQLSVMVSAMLRKIKNERKPVVYENIQYDAGGNTMVRMDIYGQIITGKHNQRVFYTLSFREKEQAAEVDSSTTETVNVEGQYQERINELEKELQYTRESLQATNEELETSNEELQSSNEELIASNEELQSTNEELQSVNEELYTVNAEYQKKIEELTELNNDMHNLLENTNIGTLFLDKNLNIRKFTELIPRITNIRDMDIGRSIRHLSVEKIYADFVTDLDHVVDTLSTRETEFQAENGSWFLVRIQPYRTQEYAVDGIIITFIDINNLKNEQRKLAREKRIWKEVFEMMKDGIALLDRDNSIRHFNQAFADIVGKDPEMVQNKKIHKLIHGKDEFPDDCITCRAIQDEEVSSGKFWEAYLNKKLEINTAPVFDDEGEFDFAIHTVRDVTAD